ncbi:MULTISPECIES: hypothetical protein [unclassified Lentimicrobium]|uniref:hypothetical protein n=1 Tax=unclassified Lentimicrobium TaxID=2677434 RepID=UPI0015556FAB|nr:MULTISPECIES: hypothetical protein [unclassified Lentimicrobium]NPD47683.1 hypothetical protein [Lentimicrobium sp. S6]NPD86127.1 hypothetical protein [Lentimicrobium sp. L6]
MSDTTLLRKGEAVLLWIYKRITSKFTSLYSKLKEWFPVLNKYPSLKYGMIPLMLALFFLLRYVIKLLLNQAAEWTSVYVGETSEYHISERVIIISIAVMFIAIRFGLKIGTNKKKNNNQL